MSIVATRENGTMRGRKASPGFVIMAHCRGVLENSILLDFSEWGLTSSGWLNILLTVTELIGDSHFSPVSSRFNPKRLKKIGGGG